ncbi:hypothetical protein P885DRAFT_43531 [Corynascus similis CBS 632.67]
MYLSTCILSLLSAVVLAAPQAIKAIDYGPCDINGNDSCKEIMDNTACFLNPVGADEIFKCISGGRVGVCQCYGCLGYTPVGEVISKSSACVGVPTPSPVRLGDRPPVTPAPTPDPVF